MMSFVPLRLFSIRNSHLIRCSVSFRREFSSLNSSFILSLNNQEKNRALNFKYSTEFRFNSNNNNNSNNNLLRRKEIVLGKLFKRHNNSHSIENNNQKNKSILQNANQEKKNNSTTTTEEEGSTTPIRIWTIPNGLTLSRILMTPYINYLVLLEQHQLACALFALAGFTDLLDGYIARKWPKTQMSPLGSILDPFADKFLICSLTISLSLAHMMPYELAIIILGRDLSLVVASLFVYLKNFKRLTTTTTAKTINENESILIKLKNSINKIQVEADKISKFNTFLQITLITVTLPSAIFHYNDSLFLILLQYLTGSTTILSALSYLYKRGSYKIN